MEFRQLQCFLVLANELNFSRAAQRLDMAQPSLSQQMRQLEIELGTDLFDRSVRPIRLTNAGTLLLDSASNIMADLDQVTRDVQRAGRGEIGRVRVGYSYGGFYQIVLTLLRRLHTTLPSADIVVSQLAESEQATALRTRRVDLVIGRVTEALGFPELVSLPLRDERLMAILPSAHRLAGGATVRLADLGEESFVMFPRRYEPVVFDNYTQACLEAGFTLQIGYEVAHAQTQALMIAAGLGVGLTGDHLALRFPEVVYLPVESSPSISSIVALWTEGGMPDAVRPLLDDL